MFTIPSSFHYIMLRLAKVYKKHSVNQKIYKMQLFFIKVIKQDMAKSASCYSHNWN